ncbi:MAG: outer membrane lipoprotein carrier protein LolA [Prevotellaceae bacterium]|jgi:outer membrane lipoprotein-sorting protein|nr:outer membrane lipoprotein carrier protein LolA [Prevotellaceae bacterium]
MRIKKYITVLFVLLSYQAFSQNDEAEKILEQLSKTMASYKCLYFEYTLKIEDVQLNTSEMKDGKALVKGKKFRISTKDTDLYNDGITQWQYLKQQNEVIVSLSDSTSDDVMANPIGFITGDRREFKQKLKGEVNEDGILLTEIDFYPRDIKMPYSYIRVRINEQKQQPYSIKYMGKDGVNYTIKIKSYTPNIEMPEDEEFVFEDSKYPGIETVDLREPQ